MEDPVVGHAADQRGRKLRQAMSLVTDAKEYAALFTNGRGIPAQSPIPPGIFGYDPDYINPLRTPDLDRARELLSEAGYPNGIDPRTQRPLVITFDVVGTSSSSLMSYELYTAAWRSIGLDVQVKATDYNKFQDKMRTGAYQIFIWGWLADYPDPENFLFLLHSDMARSKNNGPNTANYQSEAFDALFNAMQRRENDPERSKLCSQILEILEKDCPWIPLTHAEKYALYHSWLKNMKPCGVMSPTLKYQDIDPAQRSAFQKQHNSPILWPLYALLGIFALLFIPAIVTFYRERQ